MRLFYSLICGLVILFVAQFAFAEFDCEVGDVWYQEDGTPAIVTSVSEDKMQIITDAKLYEERKIRADRALKEREVRALEIIAEQMKLKGW